MSIKKELSEKSIFNNIYIVKKFQSKNTMSQIAGSVLSLLGDCDDEKSYKKKSDDLEEFEKYLLSFAKDFGSEDLVEKWEGEIIISDEASEKFQEITDDYEDLIFWDELAIKMGKRDFQKTITKEDKKYLKENDNWLPERIHKIYDKYHDEFEKNGIDNLEIKED